MFVKVKDISYLASKCLVGLNVRHFQRLKICFGPGYGVSSVPRCRLLRDTASVGRNGRRGGACRQSADCFTPIIYRGQRTPTFRGDGRRRVRLLDNRGKSTDSGEKSLVKRMDSINGTSAGGGGPASLPSAGRSAAATPRRGHSGGGSRGRNCIFFAKKSFFKVQKSNLIVVFVLFFSPLPTILSLKDAYIMYSNHRRTDL